MTHACTREEVADDIPRLVLRKRKYPRSSGTEILRPKMVSALTKNVCAIPGEQVMLLKPNVIEFLYHLALA